MIQNFPLEMKNTVIWQKDACQNIVAMETSKLIDTGD